MKTKLFILLLIITAIIFNINYIYATDIDSTNEIIENSEDIEEDITEELPSTDLLSNDTVNVSTVNSISEMNLKLNNVLSIFLIVIGILLILFAIAILIRLKN